MMRFADDPRRAPAPFGTAPVRCADGLVVLPRTPAGRLDLAMARAIADRQRAGQPVDVEWQPRTRRHAVLRLALTDQPAVAVRLAFEGPAADDPVGCGDLELAVDGERADRVVVRGARSRFARQDVAASAATTRSAAASAAS